MCNRLIRLAAVCALSSAAIGSSQVILKANLPVGNAAPGSYNFQVLAGSQRQISVNLTGGTTQKINWSIASTTGGASAMLDRGANTIGEVGVAFGSVAGSCSITGSIGTYKVVSPATVTVQAQSVDDPSQTVSFLFNICANTTTAAVAPAYQQAYKSQPVELQSYVIGNTNEAGTWNILSQPSGGDGKIADTDKRDALFSATATGRYVLRFTSAADPSRTATGMVYVSPNSIPVYGLSTPNLTQSTECYADPAFTGSIVDVGPSQKATTINSVGLSSLPAGSIVRIHNEDATGKNPTTYHEVLIVNGSNTGGLPTQPKIICGVPDAGGHLPVIDAANATGGTQQYGAVSLWGNGVYNSPYTAGSTGPDYTTISSLEIRNANRNNVWTPAGGGAPQPYDSFASCLNIRSGAYILLAGNDLHDCGNGIFVANNSNGKGYSEVTRFHTIRGNRLHANGISGDTGKHHIYTGAWYSTVEGNRFEELQGSGGGTAIKDRGIEVIHRYNYFNTPNAGYLVALNSVQDAQPYVTFEPWLGAVGETNCNNSVYCSYDSTITADQVAAFQESLEKAFLYGNVYVSRSQFLADIEVADSGGDQGYAWTNQTEMADHLGTTYFYYNTVDNPILSVFASLSGTNNGGEPTQQPMKPVVFAADNILYKARTESVNIFAFARNASFLGRWQTNLMNKGSFDNTPPIMGQPSTNVTAVNGWQSYTDAYQYPGDAPIDVHQVGLAPENFLQTPAANQQPYNGATFAPVAGAGAIGAATKISDPVAALLPVRSQYEIATGRVLPRTSLTTLGAVDSGDAPTLISMAPTAAALTFLTNSNTSYLCNYGGIAPCLPQLLGALYVPISLPLDCTWSNSVVNDCSPSATFSSPQLTFYGNNSFIPTKVGTTSGTITVSYQGVTTKIAFGASAASAPTPTSLVVTPAIATLNVGQKIQFTATESYSSGSPVSCSASWINSSPSVASITATGLVSAIAVGTTTIQVTCGDIQSGTIPVSVQVPSVVSVAVAPAAATLQIGKQQQFTATAIYSDASTKACSTTAWTSSSPATAAITSSGQISAIAPGTTMVQAMCGGIQSSAIPVTVPVPSVVSVAVSPMTVTLQIGKQQQFTAKGTYSDGSIKACLPAVWTSSSPTTATITSSGLVAAITAGTTTVQMTCGGVQSGPMPVTVPVPSVVSVAISPATTTLQIGKQQQLTTTASYSDGSTKVCSTAVWTSSSPAIATVTSSGLVTAITAGTAMARATCGGIQSGAIPITVPVPSVLSVAVSPTTATLQIGKQQQFTAPATYSDGSTKACSTTVWTSSSPAIATVASSGLVSAITTGSTWIQATCNGIAKSVAVVTVTPPARSVISVAASPTSLSLVIGGLRQLIAVASYSDKSTAICSSAVWTSNASGVSSVSAGIARGISVGKAMVTANCDGVVSNAIPISITASGGSPPPVSVAISSPSISLILGGTQQLSAVVTYSDGSQGACPSLLWTVTDSSIASISSSGLAKGLVVGSTSISAKCGTITSPSVSTSVAIKPLANWVIRSQ